jgi:hypothetical protein
MDPGRNCRLAFFRLSASTGLPNLSIETLLQEVCPNPAGQSCILAEGEMTVIQFPSRAVEKPFTCPIGIALWQEYRKRNPDGLTIPPTDGRNVKDPELLSYVAQVDTFNDCNEV